MARKITYLQAVNEAMRQEMHRDPTVVVFGEDVLGGSGGEGQAEAWGGPFGATKGFLAEFPGRILDTPISESAFIGAAMGAAASGLRPIAELMFVDFMGVCFDQIFNQGAKLRYMFGGKAQGAGRDPDDVRRRNPCRRTALGMPLPDLHPHPRPEGGDPLEPLRGQGAARAGDP